jgi:hypothetical protein
MQPLAPSRVAHPMAQELIDALRVKGWRVAQIMEDAATLRHPRSRDEIVIRVDWEHPDRIASVSINGERRLIRRALEYVRES